MVRQEGVESYKCVYIGVALEQRCPCQARKVDSSLPMPLEPFREVLLRLRRLRQQSTVGNFTDIAGIELNANGEAVAQFIQLSGVVGRLFHNFR